MKTGPVPQHFTYAHYLTGPEGFCDELINGAYYVREPTPTRRHQHFVGELYHQVRLALEDKPYCAYVAPFEVRLPRSDEPDEQIDTVVQPDIAVICDPTRLDERGVRGPPDWVVEVFSPSTGRRDRVVKVPVYERAGVREVWLVHPTKRTVAVYRLEDGRYTRPEILELKGQTKVEAVPDIRIDWDRILARLV
jgi:Uma2 family endonuclease